MNITMRVLLIVLGFLIIGGVVYALVRPAAPERSSDIGPTTFEECAKLHPVMESFPRRCATPEGLMFTEEVPGLGEPLTGTPPSAPVPSIDYGANSDRIRVTSPAAGERINSPLTITGEARGSWYFEASFPLEIRNAAGVVIANHYAEAQGEWMTENFVPFRSIITFPAQPAGSTGTIILRNDNPSGLPENARSISIPITF